IYYMIVFMIYWRVPHRYEEIYDSVPVGHQQYILHVLDSTTPGKPGVVGGEARAVLQGGMAP
ncbi:hypothetical protein, partial [Aeromonas dhakensis]|uniref:hypothetical protein n=1 Tax=Aeromonas dhakensis TaxID=196024 RepID=UPI001956A18E